jgi:hypothetical protein
VEVYFKKKKKQLFEIQIALRKNARKEGTLTPETGI